MPLLAHRDLGGEGKPPLVILHGLLGSSRNWQTTGRDLTEDFHVFALDLRNHGDSFHAPEMDYGVMVADVLAWLDAHQPGAVGLLGHSMGGKVAMRLACRFPARVARLVVVDIAAKAYPHSHTREFAAMQSLELDGLTSRQEAEKQMAELVPDWAMRQFLLSNLQRTTTGKFRWGINLAGLAAALPVLEADFLGPDDEFTGEVLFVLGGESRYFVPGDEVVAARHFPRARFVTISESGHNPHFDARPKFVRIVRDFLQ